VSSSYAGDPRWVNAKFDSLCIKCSGTIKRGEDIWFYPRKRYEKRGRAYCKPCGNPMYREFQAAVEDEDFMAGRFVGGYEERSYR
jgi:hypothetical protein